MPGQKRPPLSSSWVRSIHTRTSQRQGREIPRSSVTAASESPTVAMNQGGSAYRQQAQWHRPRTRKRSATSLIERGLRDEWRGGKRYRRTKRRHEDDEHAVSCYVSVWWGKVSHAPHPLTIFMICELGPWGVFRWHGGVLYVDERGEGKDGMAGKPTED